VLPHCPFHTNRPGDAFAPCCASNAALADGDISENPPANLNAQQSALAKFHGPNVL
jgi:hypothetical protein